MARAARLRLRQDELVSLQPAGKPLFHPNVYPSGSAARPDVSAAGQGSHAGCLQAEWLGEVTQPLVGLLSQPVYKTRGMITMVTPQMYFHTVADHNTTTLTRIYGIYGYMGYMDVWNIWIYGIYGYRDIGYRDIGMQDL